MLVCGAVKNNAGTGELAAQARDKKREMAMANDEEKIEGRLHGEQVEAERKDSLLERLIYMLLIAVMISVAQPVLGVATVIQFVIMLVNNGHPNERLADFGTDLGIWVAKAARYQTAASNVKPWPWTELD